MLFVWFISVGYWSNWPPTSFYYDMLADAFLQGRSDLLIEPDPRLAKLENPYSLDSREGIPFLTDASYFNGKYFLYWGPVPAAILAGLRLVGADRLGDEPVVFAAANVVFVFSTFIVLHMWMRYASHLPNWVLPPALLVLGLAHPMLWILNRPAIHEAAIASGQAFLMAGLFFALPVFEKGNPAPWRLAIAGSLWSLAVGSRAVLAGAVGCLVVACFLFLVRRSRPLVSRRQLRSSLAGLLLPLIGTAVLLGFYNNNRFGNPLEFGWRYHLGGRGDYSQGLQSAFKLRFLIPNAYNYLARPVTTLTVFPFVKPIWGRDTLSPFPVELPEPYYAEQVTGVLIAAPFLLYSAYLIGWLACTQPPAEEKTGGLAGASTQVSVEREFRRVMTVVVLGALAAAAPLALFSIVAARYLLDVVPLLLIGSIGGSWVALSGSLHSRSARRLTSLLYIAISILSLVIGILLAVTGFEARFEHLNPILFDRLTRFFAW